MSGPFKMKGWSPFTQKTHPDHPVTPPKNVKIDDINFPLGKYHSLESSRERRSDKIDYSRRRKNKRYSGESYPQHQRFPSYTKFVTKLKGLFGGD